MDQQQLAMRRQNYAAMSNDELTWIAATRLPTLTEEAKLALEEAIRLRKLDGFAAEVAAVKEDLAQQYAAAQLRAEKQERANRIGYWFFQWLLFIMIGTGGIIMLFHDFNSGLLVAGIGLLVLLLVQVERLFWRFIVAMFRND
ncbi:MAG: hypothetical protein RL748_1403 [Pseudomonadota bacterium]|jgi:hypothetical protein